MKNSFLSKKILFSIILISSFFLVACTNTEYNFSNNRVRGTVSIHNKTKYIEYGNLNKSDVEKNSIKKLNNIKKDSYKKSEILIKYKANIQSQEMKEREKSYNLEKLNNINSKNGEIIKYRVPDDKSVEEMVKYYNKQEDVEWASPNYKYYLTSIPNDSNYDRQWGHINTNLEAAWDLQKGNYSTKVAVIDSGIIPNHPDLEYNLLEGYDFVDYDNKPIDETIKSDQGSHGTHVAGIIGAIANNNRGVAGVNWDVNILPLRVFDEHGTSSGIIEAIYYAIEEDVDVINMSFGGPQGSEDSALHQAIQDAVAEGIIVVASSGNGGADKIGDDSILYPAAFDEVISVGAVNIYNERTNYSNYGPKLDLVAPGGSLNEDGGRIYSTWGYYENNSTRADYSYMSGTSMAAPYVSGVAALLFSDGLSSYQVKDRLLNTAVDLGARGRDDEYGYGLVDAYAALRGEKLKPPYVFAANFENGSIKVKSELKRAYENGDYYLNEVDSGYLHIIAWRDINGNGIIDAGDYYGESSLTRIEDDIDKIIDIDMYYVSKESEIYNTNVLGMERH
ncbi:MAG: S8 family peptidase [Bacillota bacterium]